MNILLFGKNGQLGSEFKRILPNLGSLTAIDQEDLDLCNTVELQQFMNDVKAELIVNASAFTAVDRAETESDIANKINAIAPGVMAEAARRLNAVFIHFSTDYVFDGTKNSPYTEADATNPLNEYGKSKLAGEQNIMQAGGTHIIFRTSWVYSMHGEGFVKKVLGWARKNKTLRIVNDQISNPTWARTLAEATVQIITRNGIEFSETLRDKSGLYHLAGNGYTSRYEWAKEILAFDPKRNEQIVQAVESASSDEFPTPATRPMFSALDCLKIEKTFGVRLPDWRKSLRVAMSE